MAKYVLVVEDDERQVPIYQRELTAAGLEHLVASDLETARNLFTSHQSKIVAVILDGSLSGGPLDILPLVQWMQAEDGTGMPKIAASTRQDYRLTMMQYGCTGHAEKRRAVQRLIEQLQELGRWS